MEQQTEKTIIIDLIALELLLDAVADAVRLATKQNDQKKQKDYKRLLYDIVFQTR